MAKERKPDGLRARAFRFTDRDIDLIDTLARLWGGRKPLSRTDAIRQAVRDCVRREQERKKDQKSGDTGIDKEASGG